jgi:hypothetical protein
MSQTLSPAWNSGVQVSADGMFTDAFLTDFHAVRARHKVAIWQIAKAAKFSPAYLGNLTRYWGDSPGKKLNVSTGFANRLAAVVEALKRAKSDDDVREALNPGEAAPAAVAEAALTQPDEALRADEDDGPDWTLEHALAILRRHGVTSIALSP